VTHETLRDASKTVNAKPPARDDKVRELTGFVGGRYDATTMDDEAVARRPRERGVTCPTCRTRTSWQGNPYRAFGVWLDARYRIPAEKRDDDVP
jgi:endogenous inhibitor of DNA gyrase (YacG/DUF329 family)